jgi:hypothetical protein
MLLPAGIAGYPVTGTTLIFPVGGNSLLAGICPSVCQHNSLSTFEDIGYEFLH